MILDRYSANNCLCYLDSYFNASESIEILDVSIYIVIYCWLLYCIISLLPSYGINQHLLLL